MSARPEVTRENIQELFRSVLEEEEFFDKLGQLPEVDAEVYDETARARSALLRSAGVPAGLEFAREVHGGALAVADERLARFGCDFLKAAYLSMAALKMDGDARDFVTIILAASGGSGRRLIITDEQLARLSGYSDRTVRTKRRAYLEWQHSERGWTAVRVIEGKYDHETGKNIPTQYEVPFAQAVIQVLREWRTYYQQQLNQPEVPDRDAETEAKDPGLWQERREERASIAFAESTRVEVFERITNKVIPQTLDCEPSQLRRKEFKPSAAPPQKDELAIIEAQMLALIARGRDKSRQKGMGAYTWWTEFKRKAAVVLAERTPGFPDPDEE